MNVPPSELAPVALDRQDDHECFLDNLRKARTLDHQKQIIKAWEQGILQGERQRIRLAMNQALLP